MLPCLVRAVVALHNVAPHRATPQRDATRLPDMLCARVYACVRVTACVRVCVEWRRLRDPVEPAATSREQAADWARYLPRSKQLHEQ